MVLILFFNLLEYIKPLYIRQEKAGHSPLVAALVIRLKQYIRIVLPVGSYIYILFCPCSTELHHISTWVFGA